MHLRKMIYLGATTLGVSAAAGVAVASATTIKEAGTAAIYPLVAEWGNRYTSSTVVAAPGGSQAGIDAAADPSSSGIDIGASNAPETHQQYESNNGTVVEIPWAVTATTAAYHVAGVGEGLKLSATVLAKIFTDKITRWSNPAIVKANPTYAKALKAAGTITPVYSTNGSGDNYAFQLYLQEAAGSAWGLGYGDTWLGYDGVHASGFETDLNDLRSIKGSIGYLSAYYAITGHVDAAAVENAAGRYELPNASEIEAAARSNTHVSPQGPTFTGVSIVNPAKKYATAYPIATYTYALVNEDDPSLGAVESFLNWTFSPGQRYGGQFDFIPLPTTILSGDKMLVRSL